jgi:hypothetical protein
LKRQLLPRTFAADAPHAISQLFLDMRCPKTAVSITITDPDTQKRRASSPNLR